MDILDLPHGTKLNTGATVLADFDFETYSPAGYYFDENGKRRGLAKSTSGLACVGAPVYSEHPDAESLCMAYDLKDGKGPRLWVPGMPNPQDLFDWVTSGQLIEAHNSGFEYLIWTNVCVPKYGFPPLPFYQLRCSAAKCAAWSLPRALAKAGHALDTPIKKDKDGKRLLDKFSIPRTPTKQFPNRRILPKDDPSDISRLYNYCLTDIKTEANISARVPDLSEFETNVWLLDQMININGVQIDVKNMSSLIRIVEEAFEEGVPRLKEITSGYVNSPAEVQSLKNWLGNQGVHVEDVSAPTVDGLLANPHELAEDVVEVLKIRSSLGASSVKKLYSMRNRVSEDGRIREMFMYFGADRTGRWAGRGPQPQNLPNSGPYIAKCKTCDKIAPPIFIGKKHSCGGNYEGDDWCFEAVELFLEKFVGLSFDDIRGSFPDPVAAVSGCLRGLFTVAPGKDMLCSDYSAIEAVVLAAMAREEWRLEVFRTHGKIYEMSASKITGIPFQEFLDHKKETGQHHPMRKKVGKVAELASGYQGWVGAWKQFGADKFMNDEEIRQNILKWRSESPMIKAFWYAVENGAKGAVSSPGTTQVYNDLKFHVENDVLYITLPSGRRLNYHQPRIVSVTKFGKPATELSFMGVDSYTNKWSRISTYGGKLTENIIQAVSRDILAHAMLKVQRAGYNVCMHIHDEIVVEVPEGWGSIEELETLMADLPEWCNDWPIRAAGGWRGKRYRKD